MHVSKEKWLGYIIVSLYKCSFRSFLAWEEAVVGEQLAFFRQNLYH